MLAVERQGTLAVVRRPPGMHRRVGTRRHGDGAPVRPLVIDASAALAHVVGEPDAARVEGMLRDRDDLLVPWIFWTEIINVLGRRHRWQGSRVLEAVYDLEQLPLLTEP